MDQYGSDSDRASLQAGKLHVAKDGLDSETDESEKNGIQRYLDDEAEESASEFGYEDGDSSVETDVLFPQFCRLPIELRRRVWELFDIDMKAPARLFNFTILVDTDFTDASEDAYLDDLTAPARAVLATHRESRSMALQYYPDTAIFRRGTAMIRCHKGNDIILLEIPSDVLTMRRMDQSLAGVRVIDGFQQIALSAPPLTPPEIEDMLMSWSISQTYDNLPHLKYIYLSIDSSCAPARELRAVVTNPYQSFHRRIMEQDEIGRDIPYDRIYCWPKSGVERRDQDTHLDKVSTDDGPDADACGGLIAETPRGQKIFRMIQFELDSGVRRFEKIERAAAAGGAWENTYLDTSDDSSQTDSEESGYESEGIDDATINESEGSESDEDDLLVRQDSEGDEDVTGGFSPLQQNAANWGHDAGLMSDGEFSSLESESSSRHEDNDLAKDINPVSGAKRARRRIVESDDEEEEYEANGDGDREVPERVSRRRERVVLSDSEEAGEDGPRPAKRTRHRVVDDDDISDGESKKDDITDKSSGDQQEESSDDEEQDEEGEARTERSKGTKMLSLAERLQIFRSEVPPGGSLSESGSEDTRNGRSDDDDQESLDEFQDDDEDEASDNDQILDVAEDDMEEDDGGW